MTDSIHTIFQNLIDRLSTIPKKHLDVVIAQLKTTESEMNELFVKSSSPSSKASKTEKKTSSSKTSNAPKKEKKEKDENAVKKPLSSYMLFCKDRRGILASENVAPKDVLKKLGELWKALSDDEKAVYTEKAADEKRRYEETTGVKKDTKKVVASDSDPIDVTEKKKSLSPYIRFCNEKRASVKESHPEMDGKTIIKTLGAMWRALSQHEQQSYKMM